MQGGCQTAIWIDIEDVHVDFTLPTYDANGTLVGYTNYSFGPGGNVLAFELGAVSTISVIGPITILIWFMTTKCASPPTKSKR